MMWPFMEELWAERAAANRIPGAETGQSFRPTPFPVPVHEVQEDLEHECVSAPATGFQKSLAQPFSPVHSAQPGS